MAGTIVPGQTTWSGSRDRDGHREYKIAYLVRCLSTDGPATVLQTPGLPVPGDFWVVDNDADLWATCKLDAKITPSVQGEPNTVFTVEFTFSTKGDEKRCKDQQVDDPLLIPDRISGDDVPYQEEATFDRFGKPIVTSSHEQIRGAQVEFDKNRGTVVIEQNVASLDLALVEGMKNRVNDAPLWGMGKRCVKLSKAPWEKKYYGQCFVYYTRKLHFDIRADGFDKNLLDEGTKVLNGNYDTAGTWVLEDIFGGPPDPKDPRHFKKYLDPKSGNPSKVILNGAGIPAGIQLPGEVNQYVSIFDGNVGNALSDGAAWIQLVDPDFIDPYGPVPGGYVRGNLVYGADDGLLYVATGVDAALGPGPPAGPWVQINELNDEGVWDVTVVYADGDFVSDPSGPAPGQIHVEKYEEANFLLLGIPTIL